MQALAFTRHCRALGHRLHGRPRMRWVDRERSRKCLFFGGQNFFLTFFSEGYDLGEWSMDEICESGGRTLSPVVPVK